MPSTPAQLAAMKKWREANREKAREASRLWRLKHPEKAAQYSKQWRDENPERAKELRKAWYVANPEKVSAMRKRERQVNAKAIYERNKAYMAANREQQRAWRMAHHYRHPEQAHNYVMKRRKLITGKLSRGLTKRLLEAQEWRCKACACDLHVSGYHRDHIVPLALGGPHADENIQLLCPTCNLSKGKRPYPLLQE